jgi:hypothetical protein
MMIYSEKHCVHFVGEKHLSFFDQLLAGESNPNDPYAKALLYTLGICPDTRRNIGLLYDQKKQSIIPEAIYAGWQTSGSAKVTRLAFNLFTDNTPTAYSNMRAPPNVLEIKDYSVSNIFCCEYAPYFVEAIKLRYPEYMRDIRKENIRAAVNEGVLR